MDSQLGKVCKVFYSKCQRKGYLGLLPILYFFQKYDLQSRAVSTLYVITSTVKTPINILPFCFWQDSAVSAKNSAVLLKYTNFGVCFQAKSTQDLFRLYISIPFIRIIWDDFITLDYIFTFLFIARNVILKRYDVQMVSPTIK